MGRVGYRIEDCIHIGEFFSMFKCLRSGGYEFKGETHDFWECVYVRRGKVCISADERVYDMSAGEIIFHKPMELHKYHVSQGNSAELFIFSFSAMGSLTGFFENKVFELNDAQKQIIENLITFLYRKKKRISDTKDDYINELLESIKHNPVYINTVASFLYCLFFSIYDSNEVSTELDTDSARIFKQAVKYMSENIHHSLKIEEIAGNCCISPTGLKKIFTKYAGLGIHKYFVKMKMNMATNLMRQGMSVTETAEMLGFSGQAYFSAAYKRETGRLPSEIRRA